MIEFRHILCAIDFSDTSTRALVIAAAIAKVRGATLTVVHVVPTLEEHVPYVPLTDGLPGARAPLGAEVLAAMRQVTEEAGAAGLDPALVADEGRPSVVIVNQAAALRADLIVLGTHGRGGFSRLVLGSVAEKVVRTARCPVLTVPPSTGERALTPSFTHVLCPVDFSPSSLKALRGALDLARQAHGRVTVLHALEYLDPAELCEHVDVGIRRYRQRIIDQARERLHALLVDELTGGHDIREVVVIDRAYKAVLHCAATEKVDLIVMGVQGHGSLDTVLYGSNTQYVVRAATCPVLAVRA